MSRMTEEQEQEHEREDEDMLAEDDADEEIEQDADVAMDSDAEDGNGDEEFQMQNDSSAHFDSHKDSIFCIARHPKHPSIVATGGGDDSAYVFDASSGPAASQPGVERASIKPIFKIEGHKDSVNAIAFTQPEGAFLVTAGLDGQMRVYDSSKPQQGPYKLIGTASEVEEINWLAPCPNPEHPDTIAFGASDGSVWVYAISPADTATPLSIVQAFYLHTAPSTAGAWTPDGKLLSTVAEDGSLCVWDVFGDAAAAGVAPPSGQQALVSLDANDERFRVDGGLVSVAVAPNGAFVAVGGMDGSVRIVGLPRLTAAAQEGAASGSRGGAGARGKAGGGKLAGGKGGAESTAGQAGTILASINAQSESVESIAFAAAPSTLMATGSVDGSIVLLDTARNFAVRRHVKGAHEDEAVIKVEFGQGTPGGVNANDNWLLTSCGNNGVIRREDVRTGQSREWRGHRGGGEGGGILGFVLSQDRIVTAGDDGVALVFDTK